jgi:tetratricopeptide (TPR) repeat protein
MRRETHRRTAAAAALWTVVLAAPALAQHREYYIRGKVVDAARAPVPGVEIRLRDVATSRSYDVKTDRQGTFKLAGLPHGVYEVTFAKEGYSGKTDQWKFEAPQSTMQTVDVPDVVLATPSQVQAAQLSRETESGVKEAAERLRKKDFDGAIALLQVVLGKNPRDASALFFLGVGFVQKKMYREAVAPLTQVTELTPSFAPAYFELGTAHRHLGDRPRALAAYDRSFALDPANADAAYNAGLILFETDRVDEAGARFEQALALKPADPDLREMAGRAHIHQGKFESAIEHLEKARAATSDPAKVALLDELIRKTRAQIGR